MGFKPRQHGKWSRVVSDCQSKTFHLTFWLYLPVCVMTTRVAY